MFSAASALLLSDRNASYTPVLMEAIGKLIDPVGGPWLGMGYVVRAGIQDGLAADFVEGSSTHIPLPHTSSFELQNNS